MSMESPQYYLDTRDLGLDIEIGASQESLL